ncbi:MAG: terminase small subunit [Ruminococcus sp.]|nr:terminase small subunit [Ruminococcus sp.]
MTQIKRKLKPRERLFCGYFAGLGDAERAARKAGYTGDCKLKGDRLLCEEAILEEIDRQVAIRRKTLSRMAAIGYQRLAFGSIADALRLLFAESPTEQELRDMDLFSVSDIRRNKDGMLEIKFFDRLRALEKLGADAREDNAGVAGLMEAIGRGAMAAGGEEDD